MNTCPCDLMTNTLLTIIETNTRTCDEPSTTACATKFQRSVVYEIITFYQAQLAFTPKWLTDLITC